MVQRATDLVISLRHCWLIMWEFRRLFAQSREKEKWMIIVYMQWLKKFKSVILDMYYHAILVCNFKNHEYGNCSLAK